MLILRALALKIFTSWWLCVMARCCICFSGSCEFGWIKEEGRFTFVITNHLKPKPEAVDLKPKPAAVDFKPKPAAVDLKPKQDGSSQYPKFPKFAITQQCKPKSVEDCGPPKTRSSEFRWEYPSEWCGVCRYVTMGRAC